MKTALETLVSKTPLGMVSTYHLSSRKITSEAYGTYRVNSSSTNIITGGGGAYFIAGNRKNVWYNAVRPILTLKSSLELFSGNGKSASTTYQLY